MESTLRYSLNRSARSILLSSIKKLYKADSRVDWDSPSRLMQEASSLTTVRGSATCSVVMLDKQRGKLYGSVLGDSLYLIAKFEEGKFRLKFQAEEQSHSFNKPFQLGEGGDSPLEAFNYSHYLEDKDLVILASDG